MLSEARRAAASVTLGTRVVEVAQLLAVAAQPDLYARTSPHDLEFSLIADAEMQ